MNSGVITIPLDTHGSAASSNSSSRGWPLREFITDAENSIIRVAAESLFADDTAFNPLVFVGPSGTGKSRLARALVQRWELRNPGRKVLMTNGADFARSYARAVHADSLADARQRFLAADLLLLDDLNELRTKPAAQRELTILVDNLLSQDKRLVVTTQSLPTVEEAVAESLASRLAAGLTVPVPLPGNKARREIAIRLADAHEIKCDREVLYELADGLPVTAAALNGVFAELANAGDDGDSLIGAERVRKLLKRRRLQQQPSLKSITQHVCRNLHVKTVDVKGASRRKAVVHARGIAMYIGRSLTDLSFQQIGRHFSGRDHSTVLHACQKIERLVGNDPQTSTTIKELTNELQR